jgi:hypothetical protein
MKLVIIHGPPAAGKLTVATEVARRTGFKLFHNHVSIDCVKSVFDFGSSSFDRLIEIIRVETIAEAARAGVDLIHTFVYAFGEDDAHFHKLIAAAEDNGGTVHIVLLRCEDEVRKTRINEESRIRIGKLTDPESIEASRKRYELESALPGRETLVIDTALTSPEKAAFEIIHRFQLPINCP